MTAITVMVKAARKYYIALCQFLLQILVDSRQCHPLCELVQKNQRSTAAVLQFPRGARNVCLTEFQERLWNLGSQRQMMHATRQLRKISFASEKAVIHRALNPLEF